jgi:DNA invertase Pin-like site-specific DNA recombinase
MAENTGKFIAYYRVSTARQGGSGLGLEAQQKAVADYLNGGEWELEEYVEIESGKSDKNRPQLSLAISACKKQKATLIIAKLDRLSRNVAFTAALMESGVEFLAVDNPHANKLMIHMLAAFAEHEREVISQRTKVALKIAKSRGVQLGKHSAVLSKQNAEQAMQHAKEIAPYVNPLRQIHRSLRKLTDAMNKLEVPTSREGSKWHVTSVRRLLSRLDPIVVPSNPTESTDNNALNMTNAEFREYAKSRLTKADNKSI